MLGPALAVLLGLQIVFVSVGQGDAALVTTPSGRTVLVDGGPRDAATRLTSLVRARGRAPLDLVVLSHRHADHLGGLEQLIRAVGARAFVDPAFPHDTPAFRALERLLGERRIPMRRAVAGARLELGDGAALEVLGPPEPPLYGTRSDVNANSLVARLAWRAMSVLFTGDAEGPTERWLLRSGRRVQSRVLKVAHHGSNFATSIRFLREVKPEAAVISCGAGNEYRHPHGLVLRRMRIFDVPVYRTDLDGDVTVESDGEAFTVRTARLSETGESAKMLP